MPQKKVRANMRRQVKIYKKKPNKKTNSYNYALILDFLLKLTGKERPIFLRTHGKQHDGRKGMRINPLTTKRNA